MKELTLIRGEINEEELLNEIIRQLNKDLALSNVGFEFKENEHFDDFWDDLVAVVRELLNKHYEKYLQFIYRIDVEERDLLVTDITPYHEIEEFVAYQIIRRIYQKVYFRKNFTKNS